MDPLDMSNQWSCGTLEQGFGEVMVEAFHDDEQKIMAELEDWIIICKFGVAHQSIFQDMEKELASMSLPTEPSSAGAPTLSHHTK